MPDRPAHRGVGVSPAEMEVLLARAGLTLNAGQMADLVLTWRQIAELVACLPRERELSSDAKLAFRLPPPMRLVDGAAKGRR